MLLYSLLSVLMTQHENMTKNHKSFTDSLQQQHVFSCVGLGRGWGCEEREEEPGSVFASRSKQFPSKQMGTEAWSSCSHVLVPPFCIIHFSHCAASHMQEPLLPHVAHRHCG